MQEEHALRRSIRSRQPPARFSGWYGLRMYNASRDKSISAHQKKQQHASQGVEQSVSVLDVKSARRAVDASQSRCRTVNCIHTLYSSRGNVRFSYTTKSVDSTRS